MCEEAEGVRAFVQSVHAGDDESEPGEPDPEL